MIVFTPGARWSRTLATLFVAAAMLSCGLQPSSAQTGPSSLDPTYGRPLPAPPRARRAAPAASWIWSDQTRNDQTIYLRGLVELDHAPMRAILWVTADDFFTLYVNGQSVDQSRPDPHDDLVWKHVHRIDVVRYLKPGTNVVGLRAINSGGAAGALAQLDVDGKTALRTGEGWRVSEKADQSDLWTTAVYDASSWQPAHVVAPLTGDPWSSAGGLEGWPDYDGSAPYLAHLTLPPASLIDLHHGTGHIDFDPARLSEIEVRAAASDTPDAPGLTVDFGKEIAGRVELRSPQRLSVIVGTGESREEAVNSPWGGAHRLDIEPNGSAFTPYSAFRYAHLTFVTAPDSADKTARVQIAVDHKYYPVRYQGSFACSDDLMTRIWYTGAYTAHLCMQEDIWDAPKRDRARWMGDLHVSGAVIDTVFADRFLMEQTMQRLRDEAQGGRPATAQPQGHVNGIPGYSCAWICGLADFHRHLGDLDYLRKQHDPLVSLLEYLRGELDERDVFANRHGAWDYVDWSPDFNGDGPRARTATQMFLIKAHKEAEFLFDEMGDATHAAECRQWADRLTHAAQTYLLQPDGKTFSDRRQDNAMAIYAGAATPEQTSAIYDAVLQPDSAAWKQIATPYYNNYVIYAMSLAGHTDATLQVIRRFWGGMLAEGATSWWESYDPSWDKNDFHAHLQADNGTGYFVSLCHGWSSGPTSWLTERVLGVRPTGGGYRTVEIAPDLGGLDWAEGAVPTPHGLIHVRAARSAGNETLTLTLPPGVVASVSLPGRASVRGSHSESAVYHEEQRISTVWLDHPGRYEIEARPAAN